MALTAAEAQRLQDDARLRDQWLMWFVSYERTGKFIARAHTAAPDGGRWLPGELVAAPGRGSPRGVSRGSHRMTATRLCLADLTIHENEARVLDLRLAEVLEFERPRAIRQLIERNEDELRRYGALPRRVATPVNGGPQFEEYWLNEPQAPT